MNLQKYQQAIYKGESNMGVPHGKGTLYFNDQEEVQEGYKSSYIGTFNNGMFENGYLQFLDKSYYVGDFNIGNNKYHGSGRFSEYDEIYY